MTNEQLIAELRDTLSQWDCPACGGKGFYTGYSRNAPKGQKCTKCNGGGLHPLAAAAITKIDTETWGG